MSTHSIRICAIDVSYRDTGFAILNYDGKETTLVKMRSVKNPISSMGFLGLSKAAALIEESVNTIKKYIELHKCNVVVIEMPAYTQSAKSAILIGMCWGAYVSIHKDVIIIPPSALKKWSESKRGDKKTKVKEKVEEMTGLIITNDNVIDAIGIGLLTIKEIDSL
jgi:Holliday junction resolvasome RuvABC endonuclease subunit